MWQDIRRSVICKDNFTMSVQASEYHHCAPKVDGIDISYSHVEVGFPSDKEDLLMDYIEDGDDPTGTVYAYVPAQIILDVIQKHGGLVNGEIPSLDLNTYKQGVNNVSKKSTNRQSSK